jgi:hypothetical protein
MKKQTFWQWLKRQKRRADPVGDIARDAIADVHPRQRRGSTVSWWREHITTEHTACDAAVDALERAGREYQRKSAR